MLPKIKFDIVQGFYKVFIFNIKLLFVIILVDFNIRMNTHADDLSFNSQYGEEYAITLEFELQRQKEKNKILEERLRNKEIFIVEMKKMQT